MDEQLCFLKLGEGEPDITPVGHKLGAKETRARVVSICPHCNHTSSATESVRSWEIANRVKSRLWQKTGENEYTQHLACGDENCPGRP